MKQPEEPLVSVVVPGLVLKNLTNQREHWAKGSARASAHRTQVAMLVRMAMRAKGITTHVQDTMRVDGLFINLVRYAQRMLDVGDNLPASCKHVRDGVADALELDDATPAISWGYDQEAGEPAAKVEIYRRATCDCCGTYTIARRP